MEDIYLIEIRLGKTKWRVKETIFAIAGNFRLGAFIERHPHVTLFGPLNLNEGISQELLLDSIRRVASRFGPIPFMIEGWENREGMHGGVIAFPVIPSESLKDLTASIANALTPITHSHNRWDAYPDRKWFHVTIANRLDPHKAERIFPALVASTHGSYPTDRSHQGFFSGLLTWVKRNLYATNRLLIHPVTLDETGLRITVMHGEKILAEYDLLLRDWVFGGERHTSRSWQETLRLYRRQSGFELNAKKQDIPEDLFLISDLHLGHANIIRHCSRPFFFSDPDEMDRVLLDNWNYVISETSRVYFLGDLRYGTNTMSADVYRQKLQGDITFIRGDHDDAGLRAVPSSMVEYNGFSFLLVHDPADTPPDFTGWVIHGHHHNNDLRHYPFINFHQRRINVSAEVIGYVPVRLDEICCIIQSRLSSGNMAPILVKYSYTE
jgi:calcineurin-like phosphoesterase family protein